MTRSRATIGCAVLSVVLSSVGSTAQIQSKSQPTETLLDRYAAADYDTALRDLTSSPDSVGRFSSELKRTSGAWIQANGAADVARRRLIVATVALEAARGLKPVPSASHYRTAELQWKDRRELLVWASGLLAATPPPPAPERWWHLAVTAFLDQSGNYPFNVWETSLADMNRHLEQAEKRFPGEPRLALARSVSVEMSGGLSLDTFPLGPEAPAAPVSIEESPDGGVIVTVPRGLDPNGIYVPGREALRGLSALERDASVGAEAQLHIGAIEMYLGHSELAVPHLVAADRSVTEPYLQHLARFFQAAAFVRLHRATEAGTAFRAALTIVPHAQSATVGLAWMLLVSQRRAEASQVVAESLVARPPPDDPLTLYRLGDARLWPTFLAQLRSAIK